MFELIFFIVLFTVILPNLKQGRQRRRGFNESGAAVYMPPAQTQPPPAAARGPKEALPQDPEERASLLKMIAGGAVGVGGAAAAALMLVALLTLVGQESWMLGYGDMIVEFLAHAGIYGVLGAAFWGVSRWGFKLLDRVKRYRLYRRIIGEAECMPLEDLARASGQSKTALKKDFSDMIRRGYFPQGFLDQETACFYASNDAWRKAPKPPAPKPKKDAHAQLLARGEQFLQELDAEAARIEDAPVRSGVQEIRAKAQAIFSWLRLHPEAQQDVQHFAGYYLPTTLKLLHTYNEVDPHAEQSEAAALVQSRVAGVLDSVATAFATLLDNLIAETAMDVNGEITALETVLTQDGLTPDGLLPAGEP